VPTLVIWGKHDGATTPEMGEYLAKNIPGAQHTTLEAAHLSNIEQPQAYTDAVLGFLLKK
jgi:3-oxoadipate enol-lactonase